VTNSVSLLFAVCRIFLSSCIIFFVFHAIVPTHLHHPVPAPDLNNLPGISCLFSKASSFQHDTELCCNFRIFSVMRPVAMFRITTPCSLVCSYQCFGTSYCFFWGTTRTRRQEVLSRTTLSHYAGDYRMDLRSSECLRSPTARHFVPP